MCVGMVCVPVCRGGGSTDTATTHAQGVSVAGAADVANHLAVAVNDLAVVHQGLGVRDEDLQQPLLRDALRLLLRHELVADKAARLCNSVAR